MGRTIAITRKLLRRATDERSWERGERYFNGGHVTDLAVDDGQVFAQVVGQQAYDVCLRIEHGKLVGECTCPMGDGGVFCKHCVATGLAYLAEGAGKPERKTTLDDLRAHLRQQPIEELVELIAQQARRDRVLRGRLRLAMAQQRAGGPDVEEYRAALDDATNVRGFVDYHEAGGFAARIDAAVDAVEALLVEQPDVVVKLTEHAVRRIERAAERVDDSNGELSVILDRLSELHHAACARAKPDPVKLAQHLFEHETAGHGFDVFHDAVTRYAEALGERGLAEYRRLAHAAWSALPEKKPGARRVLDYDPRAWRLQSVMESLAKLTGSVDDVVAIQSRDLSSPLRFLRIAEVLLEAKREDDALAWAERGCRAFEGDPDARLEAFVLVTYTKRKRYDDALSIRWAQFERRPSLETYRNLHDLAVKARRWAAWRERAQAALRRETPDGAAKRATRHDERHEELVRVLLWEQRVDEAWNEAHRGRCSMRLWRKLAAARGKAHPADAAEVLGGQVDVIVGQTSNGKYAEAVELIREVRKLMKRTGERRQFDAWIGDLRERYRRKRNFIAMLDGL